MATAVHELTPAEAPIHQAVRRARRREPDVSHVHIRHVWPLPANLSALAESYEPILDAAAIEQNRAAGRGKPRNLQALLGKGQTWQVEKETHTL